MLLTVILLALVLGIHAILWVFLLVTKIHSIQQEKS